MSVKHELKERDMLTHAEAAGLLPNTIHAWLPALMRYTEAVIAEHEEQRQAGQEPIYLVRPNSHLSDSGWKEATEEAYWCFSERARRIVYNAPPAALVQAARS